jgi:hypothetical protein
LRLEAARSLAFLHERDLLTGITIAISATDPEIRDEVMQVVQQVRLPLRAGLLQQTFLHRIPMCRNGPLNFWLSNRLPRFSASLSKGCGNRSPICKQ